MPESQAKQVYRKFVEEVINKGNISVIPELYSTDYVDHSAPPGAPKNLSVYEQVAGIPALFRGAFPDVHFVIEDMSEEGEWVATRVTGHGTHLNKPFMGMIPTGRKCVWSSLGFFRISNGKIAEHYGQPDLNGLREQIAAVPEPGSLDENRAIVARYVYATNTQQLDDFDNYVTEDFVDHDPIPGQQPGIAGLKAAYKVFTNAMPDSWYTFLEDLIAEGDMVIGRGVIEGTHTGDFMGIPATNKRIKWTGTRIFRVRNGKVSEGWINFDLVGMMQQMGIMPG